MDDALTAVLHHDLDRSTSLSVEMVDSGVVGLVDGPLGESARAARARSTGARRRGLPKAAKGERGVVFTSDGRRLVGTVVKLSRFPVTEDVAQTGIHFVVGGGLLVDKTTLCNKKKVLEAVKSRGVTLDGLFGKHAKVFCISLGEGACGLLRGGWLVYRGRNLPIRRGAGRQRPSRFPS